MVISRKVGKNVPLLIKLEVVDILAVLMVGIGVEVGGICVGVI